MPDIDHTALEAAARAATQGEWVYGGTLVERFNKKVVRRGADECWPWAGSSDGRYGQIWYEGRKHRAPRVAWVLANKRPIPLRMVVCHACDNPACVNPAHLWLGTTSENIKDAVAKGRHVAPGGARPKRDKCRQGHAYTEENTYLEWDGSRACRACRREHRRKYDLKRRARAALAGEKEPSREGA